MPSELEPTVVCDPDHPWPLGQSRCWETKKSQTDWRNGADGDGTREAFCKPSGS